MNTSASAKRDRQTLHRELRQWRDQELEAIGEAALAGTDPAALGLRIERAAQLARLVDELEPRDRNGGLQRRIAIITTVLVFLLTASLLLLRRPYTRVSVETRASEVTFDLQDPAHLLRGIGRIRTVELAGLNRITVDGGRGLPDGVPAAGDALALHIAAAGSSSESEQISLDSFVAPAGTQVTVSVSGASGGMNLRIQAPEPQPFPVDLIGAFQVKWSGAPPTSAEFRTPGTVTGDAAGREVRLTMTVALEAGLDLAMPISVRGLSWTKFTRGAARPESSIAGGSISLEEMKNHPVALRVGQLMEVTGAEGSLRRLASEKGMLNVQFDGIVHGIGVGEPGYEQNLMPTWFDWLRQRDAMVQLWAAGAYFIGIALAINRWWSSGQ